MGGLFGVRFNLFNLRSLFWPMVSGSRCVKRCSCPNEKLKGIYFQSTTLDPTGPTTDLERSSVVRSWTSNLMRSALAASPHGPFNDGQA
jgi:hypothetical protein